MNNKMLVALIAGLTVVGSASAYSVTINNMTDKTLTMSVKYYGIVCKDDNFVLAANPKGSAGKMSPGASKTIGVGACCTSAITASAGDPDDSDNPNALVSMDMNSIQTGSGIACRGYTINMVTANGRLVFETGN